MVAQFSTGILAHFSISIYILLAEFIKFMQKKIQQKIEELEQLLISE